MSCFNIARCHSLKSEINPQIARKTFCVTFDEFGGWAASSTMSPDRQPSRYVVLQIEFPKYWKHYRQ